MILNNLKFLQNLMFPNTNTTSLTVDTTNVRYFACYKSKLLLELDESPRCRKRVKRTKSNFGLLLYLPLTVAV